MNTIIILKKYDSFCIMTNKKFDIWKKISNILVNTYHVYKPKNLRPRTKFPPQKRKISERRLKKPYPNKSICA